MSKMLFADLLVEKDGLIKGPFGGDIKKSLFVPKGKDTLKVYEQGVVLKNDINYGTYYISKEHFDSKLQRFEVKTGDLLMTGAGTLGEIITVPENAPKGVINQALLRIRLNQNVISTTFFKYYFKYYIKAIISKINGDSVIPNLPPLPLIRNTEVDIPKTLYQNKISSVLSALDSKIELNNRINAELEAMAKTLYDYWFVQFDFPDVNGNPYKTTGGKMIWNEELKRAIPEGWESIMIENCLLKESSIKKIPTTEILEKGKFPVVDQSTDFIAGFTNDNEAIIKTDEPRIIFGDHTRILKLINFDFARGADGTQVMLSNNKRMPQHLFFNTLLKIDLSNYGYARHYKFLKDISIILPNETVSKSFETTVSPFYKLIRENIFQNQKLTELRDWLLPMLMNGQVKVYE
jgi:type I restriction enzyme S subunit